MNKKKESLDISNKEYYDILSRGLKVTRSISRKTPGEPDKPAENETSLLDTSLKQLKRK